MASINYSLSAKKNATDEREIMIRFTHGRINQRTKSNIFIETKYWDEELQQIIIPNIRVMSLDKKELKEHLANLSEKLSSITVLIQNSFNDIDKDNVSTDWLKILIDQYNFPEKYLTEDQLSEKHSFFDLLNQYLDECKLSDVRDKNFRVLVRALQRYELFYQAFNNEKDFRLDIDTMNRETIKDIESFLRNEHSLYKEYPNIYKAFPSIINSKRKSPSPKPRGNNTICALFNKLRAFFRWCNEVKKTKNDPFDGYSGVTSEKYGRPFYITLEERNHIAEFDLSEVPHLEVQRDIFIFQCLIGCRVSDLLKMTNKNVNNDIIEYIPRKTKDNQPISVSVPLNDRAKSILEKYKAVDCGGFLLPFISSQKYNDAIKDIFTHCGITRIVTRLNPTTGEEEQRPINEIASSHLARRTFVGNLYKKVQDPNLIGALSGHKEGSKAFARYRDIDEEMKKTLVKMIE